MKTFKNALQTLILLFIYLQASSQTLYTPATGTSTTTGVGIGTNAPVGNFHIKNTSLNASLILEGVSSNPGGPTTPAVKIMSSDEYSGGYSKMQFLVKQYPSTPTNTATWICPLSLSSNYAIFSIPISAQSNLTVYGSSTFNGNVAIGSTSENKTLTVNGNTTALGDVVIGSTTANKNLTVNGSTISKQYFVSTPLGQWQMGLYAKAAHAQAKLINLKNSADADIFNVWGNGNVNVKLLFAEEIRVTANAMNEWWDKVFLPEYNLQSLSDVEAFVKANHRLPDLPSENEVKTQGYNLQQMDGLLLKKIEELTLYIIELQKQVETLKNK